MIFFRIKITSTPPVPLIPVPKVPAVMPVAKPVIPSAPPAQPQVPLVASPPAKPAASAPAPEATAQEAWKTLLRQLAGTNLTLAEIEQAWFRVLEELFPGTQPADLTPAEWAVVRDEAPSRIIPF